MFILKGIDIDIDYLASISNKTKQNTKAKTRTKHLKRGKKKEKKFFKVIIKKKRNKIINIGV